MRHLFKKRLILTAALFGLSLVVCKPLMAQAPINAPQPLVELIEEGLAQNKEIQSLEAKVQSFQEEVSFAGSLEDPRCALRRRREALPRGARGPPGG